MNEIIIAGLLAVCSGPSFGVDVAVVDGALVAHIKDLKGDTVAQSGLKGKVSGQRWDLKCQEAKCKLDLDLEDGVGRLEYKTKELKFETRLSCQ